ncbi:MAG TPA: zinc ribbon domain-containing protein [Gemmatimonadaceae bacterium]|jgi:putative FmdB family regulatory protein|nr:zinc ribbon domain-containing protein [Gemmatimonadaceae bacterium]
MPTYEFRCPDGHEFEKFYRKISDAQSELPCPECGKPSMRIVSGGAGLLFKGSGFYLTDYGKNAHRKASPASSGSDSTGSGDSKSSDGSSGSSSESKGGESKPTDSKPAEAKTSSESKPAKKPSSSGTPKSET